MRRGFILLALVCCKREPAAPVEDAAVEDAAAPIAAPAPSDATVYKPDMSLEARRVLDRWDVAYNAHDANAVQSQYAASVQFYGAVLTREECKKKIDAYLTSAPDRQQSSVIDTITIVSDGVRVNFTKTVTTHGKSIPYPCYVHLGKSQSGGLRIDEESDPIADKKVASGSCEDALAALARTTDASGLTEGSTTVTPPGTRWVATFARRGGGSTIEFDPKTGAVWWGDGGEDPKPLDTSSSPTIRALVEKAKTKCK